jgi:hypothetical protein
MGARYYESLADRTTLLLQLQGFAACGDREVRDLVRSSAHHCEVLHRGKERLDARQAADHLSLGQL